MQSNSNFAFLNKVDIFQGNWPSFNLKGKQRASTFAGGLASLVILYITFLFGCTKLLHLVERENPQVNTYQRKDAYANEDKFNLKDENFMVAFALESYFSQGSSLSDSRYIKWFAHHSVVKDGIYYNKELPIYPCREEDYQRFYPVDERSKSRLERMKARPEEEQLQCIDWANSDVQLHGLEATGNFETVDIIAMPCNVKVTAGDIGGISDRIGPECIWDLQAQMDYIQPPNLIVHYNQERVNLEKFGEESIERFSTFSNVQFDEKTPSWIPFSMQRNLLSDQTSYLNWGQGSEERPYNILSQGPILPSAWTKYPTEENPDTKFKFASIFLQMSLDQQVTERETYGLLEWLGDIGGLFDGLRYIGAFLVAPIVAYQMKAKLLSNVFRVHQQPQEAQSAPTATSIQKSSQWQFPPLKKFKYRSIIQQLASCNSRKMRKHQLLLRAADEAVSKELDISKFFQRLRLNSFAVLALLDWRQKHIVSKMSRVTLQKPTDLDARSPARQTVKKQGFSIGLRDEKVQQRLKILQQMLQSKVHAPGKDSIKQNQIQQQKALVSAYSEMLPQISSASRTDQGHHNQDCVSQLSEISVTDHQLTEEINKDSRVSLRRPKIEIIVGKGS